MEGQNLWEMEWTGNENLLHEDEVFKFQHELPPLDFWYPELSGINHDLDATYLMDNLSEIPIHSSMDVLSDPTVVHEGGILAGQDGELGFPDQEIATMNSLSIPDQGMPMTSFSNLLTQGMSFSSFPSQEMFGTGFSSFITQEMNSSSFPGQEMTGVSFVSFPPHELNSLSFLSQGMSEMSFSNLPIQELNSLSFPSQDMYGTSFLNFPIHELNPLGFPSQELSMMDILNFPTQETFMNTLEFLYQGLPMMDTFGIPTQESFMSALEFPNLGLPMMETFGLPTQESFMNPLEFPNPGMPMMDTLGLPTRDLYMNMLEFPNQNLSMLDALNFTTQEIKSLEFPNQTQSMIMPIENIVNSSEYDQLQEEFDPIDVNDNGDDDYEPNLPLRLMLSKEMISQYYHMSIIDAAKALNVGTTLLKKRCRELGIERWPQRKLKSLQRVISTFQEFGESSGSGINENVQETLMQLENERKRIEEFPDLQLEDNTIQLREACYKALQKKRKQSGRDH